MVSKQYTLRKTFDEKISNYVYLIIMKKQIHCNS